jgi:hypothetical protein
MLLLINKLLVEVEGLKNSHSFGSNNSLDNQFIINEINDRNSRATNLMFYNIEECDSNKTDERITHDFNQIQNIIKSIGVDNEIIPSKVIRLGRYQSGKLRPTKAVFLTSSNPFDILKNKRKLSFQVPSSRINISSDRTLHQRDSMRKLREKLAARSSNGETGLTIKFIKGVPRIVKNAEISNSKPQDFLIST